MNIFQDPKFADTTSFVLAPDSPCIDAGDRDPAMNDVRIPPSRGTVVNDIGAWGGPNVLTEDADMDGLLDSWELKYFPNIGAADGDDDGDLDGLLNLKEQEYGTDPTNEDTDHDGFNDLAEIKSRSNPLDAKSVPSPELSIRVSCVDLEFNSAKGRTYQLRASEDLQVWDNITEPLVGDGNQARKRFETIDTGYRFFMLKDVTAP